ncbi:hypothetical protein KIPE111705_04400 [Kibdelosporangium persicum]|uniref:Guanylate cyclase domain-containing protein n=1 Tax=Kibdelosporangium persicum TaxID=2698649 RepID=A0ABX2F591_9PSEU|nr:hypothetical protein [Kibdelosporangium persicum]NRN66501.1 hypothetical protein [Kibdelosporangium persicum]
MHLLSSVHRAIVLIDVEKFGDPSRTIVHQRAVREGLYEITEKALTEAGILSEHYTRDDRGDGILLLVDPVVPKCRLIDQFPSRLVAAIREHNAKSADLARIRLRLAIDAGEVLFDRYGVTGGSVTRAFRLIDAPILKEVLGTSTGLLAMIVSDRFYDDIVRHVPAAAPDTFLPSRVTVKETDLMAWIRLPDHPFPRPEAGKVIDSWWRRLLS